MMMMVAVVVVLVKQTRRSLLASWMQLPIKQDKVYIKWSNQLMFFL